MFSLIVCGVFLACVVNAGFFHNRHSRLTIDMNGFHDGMHNQNRHFGPPPPPIYGPPPFSLPHHQYHHQHGPNCHHGHGNGYEFGNMMPFNPHFRPNMPFIPQTPFGMPNINNQQYPQQNPFGFDTTYPSNRPVDPFANSWPLTDFNTPIPPLDANTAFPNPNVGESSTAPSNRPFDADGRPQNGIPSYDSIEKGGNIQYFVHSDRICENFGLIHAKYR